MFINSIKDNKGGISKLHVNSKYHMSDDILDAQLGPVCFR